MGIQLLCSLIQDLFGTFVARYVFAANITLYVHTLLVTAAIIVPIGSILIDCIEESGSGIWNHQDMYNFSSTVNPLYTNIWYKDKHIKTTNLMEQLLIKMRMDN